VYTNKYPHPLLPTPSCFVDPEDTDKAKKICDTCKSQVKVEVLPKVCPFPQVESGGGGGSSFLAVAEKAETEAERTARGAEMKRLDAMTADELFLEIESLPGGGGSDPDFPGPAAFKSLKERCEKLQDKVKSKFGDMKQAFTDKLCSCTGCCSGDCFFPVTERIHR